MSFFVSASTKYLPAPSIAKIVSTNTEPVITDVRLQTTPIAVGISDVRSAWRRIATFFGTPFARAVRT